MLYNMSTFKPGYQSQYHIIIWISALCRNGNELGKLKILVHKSRNCNMLSHVNVSIILFIRSHGFDPNRFNRWLFLNDDFLNQVHALKCRLQNISPCPSYSYYTNYREPNKFRLSHIRWCTRVSLHWKPRVAMTPSLSSPGALQVVIMMITCGAQGDVGIMTVVDFRYYTHGQVNIRITIAIHCHLPRFFLKWISFVLPCFKCTLVWVADST